MYYIYLCYIPEDTGGIQVVLYIVLCNISQGTDGVDGVLYPSLLHPPGYWWYIRCIISLYVTPPRILMVCKVIHIFLYYIQEDTGGQ